MATFTAADLACLTVTATPQELCIRLPGGQVQCVQIPQLTPIPSGIQIVKQMFAQFNAALAPFSPIFVLISAVTKLTDCLSNLTSTPPDFNALAQCIPGLMQLVNQLLAFIPILNIPLMVADILSAIIMYMQGVRNELMAIVQQWVTLLDAYTIANNPADVDATLSGILSCAQANFTIALVNLDQNMQPVNALIAAVNSIIRTTLPKAQADEFTLPGLGSFLQGQVANIDASIPVSSVAPLVAYGTDFTGLTTSPTTGASVQVSLQASLLQPLDDIITVLTAFRSKIPVSPVATVTQMVNGS